MAPTTTTSAPAAVQNALTASSDDLNAPSFLTREETSCLRTALALIITKRRLEERLQNEQRKKNRQQPQTTISSQAQYTLDHWMAEYEISGKSMTSQYTQVIPATSKEWAHLDHMMQIASQTDAKDRFDALTTHLACKMSNLAIDDDMKVWLQSYLMALTESSVSIFRAILRKSAKKKHEMAGVMLPMLTSIAKNCLLEDISERKGRLRNHTADSFYVVGLMESCFLLAPEALVRQSLEELSEYTLPLCDPAIIYARSKNKETASTRMFLQMALFDLLNGVIAALSVRGFPLPGPSYSSAQAMTFR